MNLASWAREPLVHFVALGAVVYLALTWGGAPIDPASRVISVDADDRAQLALGFERLMGRAPTDSELDARVDQYVREEVLYREALRLGLDQDDAVVRQRMVTKMDLSASAAAELAEPDEDTLRAFFEQNSSRYADKTAYSFDQIYFSTEQGALAAADAVKAGASSGEAIGLARSVEGLPLAEVRVRFGEQFAQGLEALKPGTDWQGPVPSGFGWHFVRMRAREAVTGDFDGVRERVENDWRSAQIDARRQRAFEILRDAYRIDIER